MVTGGNMKKSSIIKSIEHGTKGTLLVELTTGRRYLYKGVPKAKVTWFRKAKSQGRFFNAKIKGHFKFEEI